MQKSYLTRDTQSMSPSLKNLDKSRIYSQNPAKSKYIAYNSGFIIVALNKM